jgi:uncharacterized membrane protein YhaH (DUF805 family)
MGVLGVLKAAYDFKGRALRRTYWLVLAGWFVAVMGTITVAAQLDLAESDTRTFLAAVAWSLGAVCVLATSIRRLHDANYSGIWLLLGFVPLIGTLILLVLMLLPGTPGPNRYGPNPRTKSPAAVPQYGPLNHHR